MIFSAKELAEILEKHEGKPPPMHQVYEMRRNPFSKRNAARLAAALEQYGEEVVKAKCNFEAFGQLLNDLKAAQPKTKEKPEKWALIRGERVRFDHATKRDKKPFGATRLGKGEILTNPYAHQLTSKSKELRARAERFKEGSEAYFWKIKR